MTTKSLGGLDVENPMYKHVNACTSINSSNVQKTPHYMNFYVVVCEPLNHAITSNSSTLRCTISPDPSDSIWQKKTNKELELLDLMQNEVSQKTRRSTEIH